MAGIRFPFTDLIVTHSWISLRYPMKKSMRVNLAAMFYEFAVMPGVEPIAMGIAAEMVMSLLRCVTFPS